MICKYCGIELDENATVCTACGKSLAEPEEVKEETIEEATAEIIPEKKSCTLQLVLSIIGLVLSIPPFSIFGLIISIVAKVLSKKVEAKAPKTLCTIGLIVSIVGIVITAAIIIVPIMLYGGTVVLSAISYFLILFIAIFSSTTY